MSAEFYCVLLSHLVDARPDVLLCHNRALIVILKFILIDF